MTTTTEPVDRTKLAELEELGGDRAFVGEVVGAFLGDGEQRMAAFESAVRAQDSARWLREAHTLKSSALSVGATVLGGLFRLIETNGRAGETPPESAIEEARAEWTRVKDFFAVWLRS